MPTIPVYKYQAEPSETSKPFIQNPSSVGLEQESWIKAVGQVNARAEEFQKERDIIDASNALSKLADDERAYMDAEYKNQGRNSFGAQKRGMEFYETKIKQYSSELSGGSARIFNERALSLRDRGLDNLAVHEAKEFQKEKDFAFNNEKAAIISRIKSGAVESQVIQDISILKDNFRELHKGFNTEGMEKQLEEVVLKEWLTEQAGLNPEYGMQMLAKYSDKISEDTKKSLMDFAEKNLITQKVDSKVEELLAVHGTNFDAMYKELKEEDNDKVRAALRLRINAEFATYQALRNEREKVGHDRDERLIGNLYLQGRYGDVVRAAQNSTFLSGDEKRMWGDAVISAGNVSKSTPEENAEEIVKINRMISEGQPANDIRNTIIRSVKLSRQDKEQYLLKLEAKYSDEVTRGRATGYKDIEDLIIPKRGIMAGLMQTPLETRAVKNAQMALDEWIDSQAKQGKYPTSQEIRQKAIELSASYQVPLAEQMKHIQEEMKRQAEELKKAKKEKK